MKPDKFKLSKKRSRDDFTSIWYDKVSNGCRDQFQEPFRGVVLFYEISINTITTINRKENNEIKVLFLSIISLL